MRIWLDLLALRWLTGHDGRPAFWKLDHMQATAWVWMVTIMLHLDGSLAACMWQLLSGQTMLVGAGHGLKGYLGYIGSKAAPTVTGSTNTQVSADLTKITEAIMKRRAESDHPGTEPTD